MTGSKDLRREKEGISVTVHSSIRASLLAFAGASVLAMALAPAAQAAGADGWRFVRVYRSLSNCQSAGHGLVTRRQAREFRCENDYDKAGVPVLDLYTR
jgi:hypothetical protein